MLYPDKSSSSQSDQVVLAINIFPSRYKGNSFVKYVKRKLKTNNNGDYATHFLQLIMLD